MRAGRIIAAAAVGVTAVVVGPLAGPAGASVTTTTSGTTANVTAVGGESVQFACLSGKFAVNSVIPSPQIDCSALSQVTVNGDDGNQSVYGQQLIGGGFSAQPKLIVSLAGGADLVFETLRADQLAMGGGDDQVILRGGGQVNTAVDLGTGTGDTVNVGGTEGNDVITAVSTGTTATIGNVSSAGGSATNTVTGMERIYLSGGAGHDTITTTGVTTASSATYLGLEGGSGDDTIQDGPVGSGLFGGPGTNTLTGGAGTDAYWTESPTDTINGGSDSSNEFIYDTDGPRSGGRTVGGFTALDTYVVQAHQGDVTQRVRQAPTADGVLLTTSLTRPGQQKVPVPTGKVALGQAYVGALPHKGLADVVAQVDAEVSVTLATTGGGILDITVPAGGWTASYVGTTVNLTSSYGLITATHVPTVTSYQVHGPWTNKNEGFAHRATRDLLFRFTSSGDKTTITNQLTAGTRTRTQVAAALINTDEYRGLDVDRTFLKYLRRVSDPGGRTYWINRLREGRALWRFRAQLFGSNEYFTKAGATNESYVNKAYTDVLGRTPDASGQAYWTNKLENGADRGSVALQFINSAEARRRLVDEQFLRFLDRLPTTPEQDTWTATIKTSTTGEQDLIRFLVASNAYFHRDDVLS